jgi:hypothetical protein
VYLEDAADSLLGRSQKQKAKCKVRRLYDISNILNSLGLVEKTFVHTISTGRRTAFRWIGMDIASLPAVSSTSLFAAGVAFVTTHTRTDTPAFSRVPLFSLFSLPAAAAARVKRENSAPRAKPRLRKQSLLLSPVALSQAAGSGAGEVGGGDDDDDTQGTVPMALEASLAADENAPVAGGRSSSLRKRRSSDTQTSANKRTNTTPPSAASARLPLVAARHLNLEGNSGSAVDLSEDASLQAAASTLLMAAHRVNSHVAA